MFALAIAPLLAVFMLCVESVTAYAKMRSYAYAVHMFRPSDSKYFDELVLVFGFLGRAILASATAVYAAPHRQSLQGCIPSPRVSPKECLAGTQHHSVRSLCD
jgi:hypothetical protein